MKKLLVLIVTAALLLTGLSSCELFVKGVTVEQGEDCTVITFDNFEGKKKIEISHDSPNEGGLDYKTNIISGNVKAFYDLGFLWDTEDLFEASAENNSTGGGYYIDSSVTKITICFETDAPVTGEVIISFAPIA